MTPFGRRVRQLRAERKITQKTMAHELGVSAAWLSALEKGNRGRPSWAFVQRVITYFNIIWDDADEMMELARLSHPRITVDTTALTPEATELANLLSEHIGELDPLEIESMLAQLKTLIATHRR